MIILSIDTTNKNIRILLQNGVELVDQILINDAKNQAEILVLELEKILKRNSILYNDINAFSLVNGPGTFTGLKISVAVIKALKVVFQNKQIITNNIFELLSFKENYDFIILKADINGCYICNKENKMEYMKNDKITLLFNKGELKSLTVITNEEKLVSFINKTRENEEMKNIIKYKEVANEDIVSLNEYKYKNGLFDNDIKPIYIREPQINIKKLD